MTIDNIQQDSSVGFGTEPNCLVRFSPFCLRSSIYAFVCSMFVSVTLTYDWSFDQSFIVTQILAIRSRDRVSHIADVICMNPVYLTFYGMMCTTGSTLQIFVPITLQLTTQICRLWPQNVIRFRLKKKKA